jgi:hypothetical protein
MPVYDMIEYQLVKRGVPNGFPTRLVYRTVYIIIVAFIGMTIPFFGQYTSAVCSCLSQHTRVFDAQYLYLYCVPYLCTTLGADSGARCFDLADCCSPENLTVVQLHLLNALLCPS